MNKHDSRSYQTKNSIYEAARELLLERDFNNITVQEICQEAGVSIGSFYHHFAFKEALLTELYRRGDEFFQKIVVNRIPNGVALERLFVFIKLWMHFIMTSVGVTNVRCPDKQWELFHNQMISLDRISTITLKEIVKEGLLKNEINNTYSLEQIIEFIKSYMWGFSYRWCFQKGHINSQPNFNTLIKTLSTILSPVVSTIEPKHTIYLKPKL